jgi:hypothetical protein
MSWRVAHLTSLQMLSNPGHCHASRPRFLDLSDLGKFTARSGLCSSPRHASVYQGGDFFVEV